MCFTDRSLEGDYSRGGKTMKKGKVLCVALLLGALLLATFVQVGLARPRATPDNAVVNTVTVSAADCSPTSEDIQFTNNGHYLTNDANFWWWYVCPVHFPEIGTHTVRSVTVYVYDPISADVFVDLYRTNPSTGSSVMMGTVKSTGSSATNPRAFTIRGSAITNRNVSPTRGMYLYLTIPGDDPRFYGARIKYVVK
jgi:hypothetical protein